MKNTIFYTLITLLFLLSCKKEKPEFEIQKSYHTFVIDGHLEECSFRNPIKMRQIHLTILF